MPEKPVSMRIAEFKSDLIELVNESGLPSFILLPILKDTTEMINKADQELLERDTQKYNEQMKKIEKDTESIIEYSKELLEKEGVENE